MTIKLEFTEQEFGLVKFALNDMRKSVEPKMDRGPWIEIWRKINEL